jgi:hypothetical protein
VCARTADKFAAFCFFLRWGDLVRNRIGLGSAPEGGELPKVLFLFVQACGSTNTFSSKQPIFPWLAKNTARKAGWL